MFLSVDHYCSREVDNPVYEGARHIVFRTPPPVILPSDPIYERAGAHKSALPFRYKLQAVHTSIMYSIMARLTVLAK